MPGDYFGLPDNSERQQTFRYAGGSNWSTAPVGFQTWVKPRGIGSVHILSIDPGSGGGGGWSGASGTQCGGGGAGTAGVVVSVLAPAALVPDMLYVFVCPGAAGGAAGQAGGNPGSNVVTAYGGVATSGGTRYVVVLSPGSSGPGGGGAGSASAGGNTDSAETAAPQSNSPLMAGIGVFSSIGTSGGNTGSASGQGTDCPNSKMISCAMPGAGGAGCTTGNVNSAGGGFTSGTTSQPWVPSYISGGTSGGGRGTDGFAVRSPMLFYGGCGGGSNAGGVGGAGGNGAIGSGGGGGGGGATGGAGGNGGNGLVIITCW